MAFSFKFILHLLRKSDGHTVSLRALRRLCGKFALGHRPLLPFVRKTAAGTGKPGKGKERNGIPVRGLHTGRKGF